MTSNFQRRLAYTLSLCLLLGAAGPLASRAAVRAVAVQVSGSAAPVLVQVRAPAGFGAQGSGLQTAASLGLAGVLKLDLSAPAVRAASVYLVASPVLGPTPILAAAVPALPAAPAAALPMLNTAAQGAQAWLSRPGDSAAAKALGKTFDGAGTLAAVEVLDLDVPEEEAPRELDLASQRLVILGMLGHSLGSVGRTLASNGYMQPDRTPESRLVLLEGAFATARSRMQEEAASEPALLEPALDILAQFQRIALESSRAYPDVLFAGNHILKASFLSFSNRMDSAASLAELSALAQDLADHALDLPVAEAAYFEHALPTMFAAFRAQAALEQSLAEPRTPAELLRLYSAGLEGFAARGRGLAPSDASFQQGLGLARSQTALLQGLSAAPGADLQVLYQLLMTEPVKGWLRASSQLGSAAQAQALQDRMQEVLAAASAQVPGLWLLNTFARTMDAMNRMIAERGLDPAALSPLDYADLAREAAQETKAQDAPDAERFRIARTLADGFARLCAGFAALPGATNETLRSALNSQAVRDWILRLDADITLAQAEALRAAAQDIVDDATALPAALALVELMQRAFSAADGLDDPLAERILTLRQGASAWKTQASGRSAAAAAEAASAVAEEQFRVLEALAARDPGRRMSAKLVALMEKYFLPPVRAAQTLEGLKAAARGAAETILSTLSGHN